MTMTLDHQSNRHLGGLSFDHLPGSAPHNNLSFNNPWSSSATSGSLAYQPMPSHAPAATHNMGFDAIAKQAQRNAHAPLPYPSATTVPTSAPLGPSTGFSSQYGGSDLVNMSQDLLNNAQTGFSSGAPSSVGSYAPTSMAYSAPFGSVAPPPQPQESRRMSSASQPSFSDALDASRGMVALSSGQDLTTPRGLYDTRNERSSHEGYGFPVAHSSHSSVSGASSSYGGSYYAESVGSSSMSDYGSQSDLESVNSRTLPRPSGLSGSLANTATTNAAATTAGLPPPQSMMSQFNSKISSSTQKKHKCKVCDKRFTRPSSLQTHMYSHTGEKPYACDEKGCGRHFSVVSNLRRHRKVHEGKGSGAGSLRGEGSERDGGSPEGSWASSER